MCQMTDLQRSLYMACVEEGKGAGLKDKSESGSESGGGQGCWAEGPECVWVGEWRRARVLAEGQE
jgi:hypothetical protein